MTESKRIERKDIVKIKGNSFLTLMKFVTPIYEKFAFKPDKDFARYLFGNFNGQDIWYFAINGEMCFTFKEFAKYLGMKYDSVKKAFQRQNLIEQKHYFKIFSSDFELWDKMSPTSRFIGKATEIVFLTFLGVWKILPSFRGEIPLLLYEWFGEKLYEQLKTFQLEKGQFFLQNQSGIIIEQILGDPNKNFIDCRGFRYSSKGELLIANILHGMDIPFQYNAPIELPKELQTILKEQFNCNWGYITADFLLRAIPKTVIEYWGMIDDPSYNWKRKVKETCYSWLRIKLVSIESHEDQNAPELKKKLRNLLKLKKEV